MALFCVALLIVLPFLLAGPTNSEESIAYIEKQVHRSMKKLHLPAYAITIVEDQDILYQKATGVIDWEKNIPASTTSVFKLWSLSKNFTAIEIFREFEEGLVDLDRPWWIIFPTSRFKMAMGRLRRLPLKVYWPTGQDYPEMSASGSLWVRMNVVLWTGSK